MTALKFLLAGGAAAAALMTAAPASAQYYPGYGYPGYGYGGGNVVGQVLNQVLGGGYGYNGYSYGANSQVAVNQCMGAVQQRLAGYSGYGAYGGGYGYANGRVLGVSRVEPRSNGGLTVRGVASSGRYGYGNQADLTWKCKVDYRGFVSGVTVYFPVFVPGALLCVGDGHAVQGDGEIVGTGIEISFEVQFTVDLIKGKRIYWPRGENADCIFTVGNARPLDQCVQHATTEMLRWLQEDYDLDPVGANILMGQCVEYDLGNIFDPAYTMICKMPKRVLGKA